ncbi:hypothetical protein EVAR_53701_1 [Eumeta japonica]|uniref:Uncharacterized protein n=1 Tax=Eumeta variegata TaxID=151549 RepID=A0A4C1ZBC3_EUMVA|nr:hypothetical protein EVAR_53701_1 [Eumeta japonica]
MEGEGGSRRLEVSLTVQNAIAETAPSRLYSVREWYPVGQTSPFSCCSKIDHIMGLPHKAGSVICSGRHVDTSISLAGVERAGPRPRRRPGPGALTRHTPVGRRRPERHIRLVIVYAALQCSFTPAVKIVRTFRKVGRRGRCVGYVARGSSDGRDVGLVSRLATPSARGGGAAETAAAAGWVAAGGEGPALLSTALLLGGSLPERTPAPLFTIDSILAPRPPPPLPPLHLHHFAHAPFHRAHELFGALALSETDNLIKIRWSDVAIILATTASYTRFALVRTCIRDLKFEPLSNGV